MRLIDDAFYCEYTDARSGLTATALSTIFLKAFAKRGRIFGFAVNPCAGEGVPDASGHRTEHARSLHEM